ncbi:MAG: MFS transporter [Candidatus Wallbacteria bacterium]|nr:MFS transporter [Candidatus Wallbacteria bacterium]
MTNTLIYFKLNFFALGFIEAVMMSYGPMYLDWRGASTALISLFFILSSCACFFAQNFWGTVFDCFPKVRFYIVFSLISDVLLLAVSLFFGHPFVFAAGFCALMLLGYAFFPAVQASVSISYPHEAGKRIGELMAFKSIGWLAASLSGIIVFLRNDISMITLLIKMALVIVLILLVASPLVSLPNREGQGKRMTIPLKEQLILFETKPELRRFAFLLLWVAAGNSLFFAYFGVYFKRVVLGAEWGVGLSMLLAAMFGAISYPLYGSWGDRKGSYFMLNFSLITYSLCYLTLALTRIPWIVIIVYGFPAYSALRIAGNLFIAGNTNPDERGTGMGLMESIHAFGGVVGPAIGGLMLTRVGYSGLPWVAVVFMLLYWIPCFCWKPSARITPAATTNS